MNKRPNAPLRRKKGAGTALVLTLFFILLISALVVALLISMRLDRSSTQGYYQSARVQELATGALEEILADMKSEIDAGSKSSAVFDTNGTRIYVPYTNIASQPARIGFSPGTNGDYAIDVDTNRILPSLVRVSRANVNASTIFPAGIYDAAKLPPQRASAVSTTNYSVNGRTISPRRWNSSFLLSGATNPPSRFITNTPDWVYVTRGGSRILTDADIPALKFSGNLDDTNTLVGRYSYIVYDAGALIDINCAGFPSSLSATNNTNGRIAVRGKSSLLYASLTTLPGLTNKTTEIDNLVAWRGKGSITSAGSFLNATTNWSRQGFLQVTNGDSPLLSRRDLIDYFTKKVGTTAALPFLGTFSRALSAPSARPATPTDSSINYDNDADKATAANRDLANVRFAIGATVTHYADDASSKTYDVKAGDPLLQSRFSLARLDWLRDGNPDTGDGPLGQRAAAIKSCFGLVWDYPGGAGSSTMANGGNKCWNYVGAGGTVTTAQQTIKTLAQVAAEGREPDFFELLKAAILSGSLGKDPGMAAFNNGTNVTGFNQDYYFPWGTDDFKKGPAGFYCYTFGPSSSVPVPARIPDMQIIRIGANIIDQYDPDSFPTAIYFKYQGVSFNDPVSGSFANPIFGPVAMAYGTENLPYLQAIRQVLASPTRSSSGTPGQGTDLATNVFAGWRQPYLWNPHQPPPSNLPAGSRPANYQIRAYGTPSMTSWTWSGPAQTFAGRSYATGSSPSVEYFETNSNGETSNVGTINFSLSDPTTATAFCFHEAPFPLMQNGTPNVTATSPETKNLGTSDIAFFNENMPSPYNIPNHFVGFSTGQTLTSDGGVGSPYRPFYVSDMVDPNNAQNGGGFSALGRPEIGNNTYILGWLDSGNRFHPYSYLTGVFTFEGFKLNGLNQRVGTANPDRGSEAWILVDPRTERFSLARGLQAGFQETINVYRGNNQGWYPSARPRAEAGFSGVGYNNPPYDYTYPLGDLMVNWPTDPRGLIPPTNLSNERINYNTASHQTGYYTDPDGVVRPGDGFYGSPSSGDGLMTFLTAGAPTGSPIVTSDQTVIKHARRPVILNRPFRSVAELGYVFRDLPFKSLDFFTDRSADTALLDVFCLNDVAIVTPDKLLPLMAGRINPSSASVPVLKALVLGGAKKESEVGYNLQAEADNLAKAIAAKAMRSTSFVPFQDYKELVPALVEAMRSSATTSPDKGNKANLEAPLRALSEANDFRTWNLMIDLIAQNGQMSPKAAKLGDFVVEAECRVWLHVAIDRFTGEVVARQIEPVYE